MARLLIPNYLVLRDTREKERKGWVYEAHTSPTRRPPNCIGMVEEKLDTGDYSVRGYQDLLAIERKQDFCELWNNYGERERFENEMERMAKIRYSFILIESHLTPEVLGLSPPQFRTGVPGKALTEWLVGLQIKFGVHIMCVGSSGRKIAQQIMEQVVRTHKERYSTSR